MISHSIVLFVGWFCTIPKGQILGYRFDHLISGYLDMPVLLMVPIWVKYTVMHDHISYDQNSHRDSRVYIMSWCRHQMETFSALLAFYAGNSPLPGEFPAQRPVTRSFDVFVDLRPNKRLSKQWWGWWFETPSGPLCRHCSGIFPWVTSMRLRQVSEWLNLAAFLGTADSEVHIVHISRVTIAYTLESLSSLT